MVLDPSALGEVRPEDVQASFCDVLVDEWIAQGVGYAAIAPGSRSTPLALAIKAASQRHRTMIVDVFHDERSAAFAALGSGVASGKPGLVLCTSGTAAAHLHAAVIEADLSDVPMIVCTADRPAELRDVGAPQTIDQVKLFGSAVRWFHDPGVPSAHASDTWRSLAARTVWSATSTRPGPVHLNLPFREPLVGRTVPALVTPAMRHSPHRIRRRGRNELPSETWEHLVGVVVGRRGVIIAGRGCGSPDKVDALAKALGWPVFAEPRAQCGRGSRTIHHFDALVRVPEILESLVPEVVLRLGEAPASKVLAQWVLDNAALEILVDAPDHLRDPQHRIDVRVDVEPEVACEALTSHVTRASRDGVPRDTWFDRWRTADGHVRSILVELDESNEDFTGPTAVRAVIRALESGSHLVVSSSMPIRDVEWFAGDCSHVRVHANRGANGIDGVIATAVGVARTSGSPTYVLLGDVAAIHDSSTLLSLASRHVDVRIVVVNNDGGGIFHHLPQASIVDPVTFEQMYGTPHGLDFSTLGQALGLTSHVVSRSAQDLSSLLNDAGPSLIEIKTDRVQDLETHRRIHALVAEKLQTDGF